MKCKLFYAISLAMVAAFCLSACQQPVTLPAEVIQMQIFEDKFAGAELDANRWLVAYRQWGGADANGGVVPENVRVADGKLIIAAHGDQYVGPAKGINRDHSLRADGKRVGGAIATRAYFASGRYEVRMKVVPKFGTVSALWTLQYSEYYPGDPEYIAKPVGKPDYYAMNHEIDIEFPGRPGPAHTGFDFSRVLLTTWVGENDDEHTVEYAKLGAAQNDGQFHTYRFDWHTGSTIETRRVEFYVDGVLQHITYTHVPTHASRFWIGVWFPRNWAGTPDFATEYLTVDWVRITPFGETGDVWQPESFPADGWANLSPSAKEN
jgi:beta-glucanase (GH16 family)